MGNMINMTTFIKSRMNKSILSKNSQPMKLKIVIKKKCLKLILNTLNCKMKFYQFIKYKKLSIKKNKNLMKE